MIDANLLALAQGLGPSAKGSALRVYVILRERGVLTHEWKPIKIAVVGLLANVTPSRASMVMRWLEFNGHIEAIKHPKFSKEYRLPPTGP